MTTASDRLTALKLKAVCQSISLLTPNPMKLARSTYCEKLPPQFFYMFGSGTVSKRPAGLPAASFR